MVRWEGSRPHSKKQGNVGVVRNYCSLKFERGQSPVTLTKIKINVESKGTNDYCNMHIFGKKYKISLKLQYMSKFGKR